MSHQANRRICVFTGTRAEYGLLRPVIRRLAEAEDMQPLLLVTGAHLSERHGRTVDEIAADGTPIAAEVPVALGDDSPRGVATAMGAVLTGCAEALADMQPDALLLLGDRWECLACASAAAALTIPLAHIHGGETTLGAMDEQFRHAVTKLAHLHLTSCAAYRRRVIQMGEDPARVLDVGALGVENARTVEPLDRAELAGSLDFDLDRPFLLATYHPVTMAHDAPEQAAAFFRGLRAALDARADLAVVLTGANADPGGKGVDALSAALAQELPGRVLVTPSLGLVRYLSAMRLCAAVVGNSSSGILEAPSFGVPTVNVGERQAGRIRAESVIDCAPDALAVQDAIRRALSDEGAAIAKRASNPYEQEGTSRRIVEALRVFLHDTGQPGTGQLGMGRAAKPFHDMP